MKKSKSKGKNESLSSSLVPDLVAYKTLNAGKLFTVEFNRDDPYLLAAAGDGGLVAVWESDEIKIIEDRFKDRVIEEDLLEEVAGEGEGEGGEKESSAKGENSIASMIVEGEMAEVDGEGDEWMDDTSDLQTSEKKEVKKKKKKFMKDKDKDKVKK